MIYKVYSNVISAETKKIIYRTYFKFRYIILYILIGFLSILFELQLRKLFLYVGIIDLYGSLLSLLSGIIVAFYLNIRINFKISPGKIKQSFFYFSIISGISFLTQFILSKNSLIDQNYDLNRIFMSGLCFVFFYFLHKKLSFKNTIKTGVAIYVNGIEDISKIYEKIESYPDFIQVDIVDDSFYEKAEEVKSYRLETIKAYWPKKEIHVHIMSKKPSFWIDQVLDYADKIFFHFEIDENINALLKKYNYNTSKFGLAVSVKTNFDDYKGFLKLFKNILLVTIPQPGYSGQTFSNDTYKIIEEIKKYEESKIEKICIDGGINENNIKSLKVDEIVSGSYVLNANDPIENLLKLQFNL